MRAVFGSTSEGREIVYDPATLTNPHVLITGVSGSGKTTLLRAFLTQLTQTAKKPARIHTLDVHGDITIQHESSLLFSRQANFGFNPLMVDPDPHGGGVLGAIDRFFKILATTANYRIGDKQEAVLRSIITEVFQRNGFYPNKPASWRLDDGITRSQPKRNPVVEDVYNYAQFKYKQLFLGGNVKTLSLLREVTKKQRAFISKARSMRSGGVPINNLGSKEEVRKTVMSLKEAFNDYLNDLMQGDGEELHNLLEYPSADVLSGVISRLKKLHEMRIFSGESPPFNTNSMVWRYELNKLEYDDSIIFVNTVASAIFMRNLKKGKVEHGEIRDIIVIDEAKRYLGDTSESSILSTISNEGRKFGVALISVSQSHSHFTADVIQSAATSIMLKQDSSNYNKIKNLTGVTPVDLKLVAPKTNALIRVLNTPDHNGIHDDSYAFVELKDFKHVIDQHGGGPTSTYAVSSPEISQQPVTVRHHSHSAPAHNSASHLHMQSDQLEQQAAPQREQNNSSMFSQRRQLSASPSSFEKLFEEPVSQDVQGQNHGYGELPAARQLDDDDIPDVTDIDLSISGIQSQNQFNHIQQSQPFTQSRPERQMTHQEDDTDALINEFFSDSAPQTSGRAPAPEQQPQRCYPSENPLSADIFDPFSLNGPAHQVSPSVSSTEHQHNERANLTFGVQSDDVDVEDLLDSIAGKVENRQSRQVIAPAPAIQKIDVIHPTSERANQVPTTSNTLITKKKMNVML